MWRIVLLLFLALVVRLIWLRAQRSGERVARRTTAAPSAPLPMLECAHCGMHVPQADAVTDARGVVYCSAAHLRAQAR